MAAAAAAVNGTWARMPTWPDNLNPHNPDDAWGKLSVKRDVHRSEPIEYTCEQPPNTLRLVCVSDTHAQIEGRDIQLPKGDVLVHGGDFTNVGEVTQCDKFADWIEAQPFKHKVVIAGNHDLSFDPSSYPETRMTIARGRLPEECPAARLKERLSSVCHYLEDSAVDIEGVTFYGSPWTPTFCNWGFNADRGETIAKMWKKIPDSTDVLVTHGPPIGYGDACSGGNRAGCVDLLREIEGRVRPQAHIFGHIHEGYGLWESPECPTKFVNASTCTLRYKPDHPAIVVDILKVPKV